MNRSKKKKNFVLLEVLIAFALVSISVLPFLHYPFQHMQEEIQLLFQMELEKVAQDELVDLQIKFFNREIPSEYLFGEEDKKRQLKETEKVNVHLCKGWNRAYIKKVFIKRERQKLSDDQTHTVFVNFEVQLFSKSKPQKAELIANTKLIAQTKKEK